MVKMEKQPIDWITVNGNHVPIFEGQSKKSAVFKFFEDKECPKKRKGVQSDKRITIFRSLGASAKNYPVRLPNSRQRAKFAEGQIIKGKAFAGKGTGVKIRERFWLEANYKKEADSWMKMSGNALIMIKGKVKKAEVHWYQSGQTCVNFKVKRYLD